MRNAHILAVIAVTLMITVYSGAAFAAGSTSSSSSRDTEAKLDRAERMIKSGDARGAIPLLKDIVQANDGNADAYNFLGLAYRKLGQYEQAKQYYDKALSLNPEHKGAHEYLGELYLNVGEPAKAERQLAALDRICPSGCEEYAMLKRSLEEYRSSH